MSKTTIGNCGHCSGSFIANETIWMMKGNPYHPHCIKKNRELLEKWRSLEWHQKDVF